MKIRNKMKARADAFLKLEAARRKFWLLIFADPNHRIRLRPKRRRKWHKRKAQVVEIAFVDFEPLDK